MDSPAVGERWALRYRLPDGRATDALGWIRTATSAGITVETAAGLVDVPPQLIIAARRVPPARGGPDPRRTSAAELEQIALPGWRADSEPLGEWTLRAAGGFTGRANSCLAVGDPGVPVEEATQRIRRFAQQHRIRPWAQVVVGSAEDAALVELGWQPVYAVVDVLAVRLADLLADSTPDAEVQLDETLTPAWLAGYAESRPNQADPVLLLRILTGGAPRVFAGVPVGDRMLAIGRGHLNRDWLGIAALWTDPAHRRRGWARNIILTLGHWAAQQGGRYAYLQVDLHNPGAIAGYERLGFRRHHTYRYLEAPAR